MKNATGHNVEIWLVILACLLIAAALSIFAPASFFQEEADKNDNEPIMFNEDE